MQTILAVDDEISVRESYRIILSGEYHVLFAESGEQGMKILANSHVDAILLDLTMPGMSGLEFLDKLEANEDKTPVIVVTASNSVTTAVDAIKRGATEYVIKPFDVDEICVVVERVLSEERRKRELQALREADASGFEDLVGDAPAMRDVFTTARQAMRVDSTVLITGESGTGKELMARAIHSGGVRADRAFVPVCCCAIPDQLVESELFGHEKGAFTGATDKRVGKMQVADQGTIFLDEIGEMPMDAQTKLLRVLQDHCFYPVGSSKQIEVDIRVICATNRDLRQAIKDGIFREDLFYRINVIPIEMPPLRKRREDIPRLAAHFVAKHRARVNAKTTDFESGAIARLASYEWPGNVRELENTIERILVHHGGEQVVRAEHIAGMLPGNARDDEGTLAEFEGLPLEEATNRLERYLILRALDRADNVQSRAAELLGTTRRILKYKMDQHEIAVG